MPGRMRLAARQVSTTSRALACRSTSGEPGGSVSYKSLAAFSMLPTNTVPRPHRPAATAACSDSGAPA